MQLTSSKFITWFIDPKEEGDVHPKSRLALIELHDATSPKLELTVVTAVTISGPTYVRIYELHILKEELMACFIILTVQSKQKHEEEVI
jgi:hypothetical protein